MTSPMHSTTTQILLNNRNNCVKSPIQLNSSEKFVKLCDNNKKQQNNLNNSVNLPPPPASPRSPRRSTSAALDYQNAVRYLNCQKNPLFKFTKGFWCQGMAQKVFKTFGTSFTTKIMVDSGAIESIFKFNEPFQSYLLTGQA